MEIVRMTNSSRLHRLVAGARARLAELETDFTREKARVDAVQAMLFRRLRGHHQRRDRLRLAVEYRQKFLDSFIRDDTDEVEQAEKDFAQAKARLDEDYEQLAVAADKKKKLTAGQEAKLAQLWKKLVKLHQPGRFAGKPDKLEAYHQLTAAINLAKANGDIKTLREIAEDPRGFIRRQGWAVLDFKDVEKPSQLKRLHEALQKEIAEAAESLKELRASPDYELCQLVEKKPDALDELAAERAKQLEIENAELEKQAERLAMEIKKLSDVD
jgi:DNA polymerase-3 subunit epsilon